MTSWVSGIIRAGSIGLVLLYSTLLYSCPQAQHHEFPDPDTASPTGLLTAGSQGVNALPAVGKPWLNNRFVYEFSPDLAADPARVAIFESACRSLLETTALVCTLRHLAPEDPDYVYVIDGPHDFSFVGRQGGCQELSILTWSNPIVVAHEIKHALGWGHEQQHPERDQFIDVRLDDIHHLHQAEFQIIDLGNEGPYDINSIMHFHPSDFAYPGRRAFQLRQLFKGADGTPGQRDHLSKTDLAEVRDFYGPRFPE